MYFIHPHLFLPYNHFCTSYGLLPVPNGLSAAPNQAPLRQLLRLRQRLSRPLTTITTHPKQVQPFRFELLLHANLTCKCGIMEANSDRGLPPQPGNAEGVVRGGAKKRKRWAQF